jgi:hypothetical protein
MPRINLTKELSVHTFAAPPARFEPLKAKAADLDRYGIPQKPKDAPLARLWEDVLTTRPAIVSPTFRVMDRIDIPLLPAVPLTAAPQRSELLAGGQHTLENPAGNFLRWVESTFTCPNIYMGTDYDDTYSCAPWVGLAGSQSSLQAGWYAECWWSNGQLHQNFSPWWRWAPSRTVWLTNFKVMPGDVLSVVVCLDLDSFVRARITFANMTSKQATTFVVNSPSGSMLQADTVGWLMQTDAATGGHLARMGAMYFDDCHSGQHEGPALFHPTQPFFMTDANGNDIAFANFLLETLVEVGYKGP